MTRTIDDIAEEIQYYTELIEKLVKRQRVLHLQEAEQGVHTPPHVVNEITDLTNRIQSSENKISLLKNEQQGVDFSERGKAFQKTGKLSSAILCYQEALRLIPEDTEIKSRLREAERQKRTRYVRYNPLHLLTGYRLVIGAGVIAFLVILILLMQSNVWSKSTSAFSLSPTSYDAALSANTIPMNVRQYDKFNGVNPIEPDIDNEFIYSLKYNFDKTDGYSGIDFIFDNAGNG